MNRLLLALCVVALVVAGKGGKGKGKGKKDDGKFGVSTPRLLWVRTRLLQYVMPVLVSNL